MKTLVIRELGGPNALSLEDRELPEPAEGQVRLRVRAVGLNHLDVWVRRGVPGHQFPLPLVPGSDVVGEVEAVGPGVVPSLIGRVAALQPAIGCGRCGRCLAGQENLCSRYAIRGEGMDGGCQEALITGVADLLLLPSGVDPIQAAAFPLSALTAWHMLVERAQLQAHEVVLVLAGASGVGSAAIQIAHSLGARVFATAGSPEKRELAVELGAEVAFAHGPGDAFHRELRAATDKHGADVVIEHVGEATWSRSLKSLAWGGRLVTCGATSGHRAEIDLRALFFKQQSLLGSTMGTRAGMRHLWDAFCQGTYKANVGATLPMSRLAEAHKLLEERSVLGKVVVEQDLHTL